MPALLARAPWWRTLAVGALCVWRGFTLARKPISSLGVLTFFVGASFVISGIDDFMDDHEAAPGRTRMLLGWGWIGTGAVVPVFIAVLLVVSAVVRGIGAAALAWPDVPLLVAAVLFGVRTLFSGLGR